MTTLSFFIFFISSRLIFATSAPGDRTGQDGQVWSSACLRARTIGGNKMATTKQRQAARKNIKKAQEAWRSMSSREHSRAQPEGRGRAKPGTTGKGEYYHIEVRPKKEFTIFRTQDVGVRGGIQRVAGKRGSGSWDTQKWLISKDEAHLEGERLVPDTKEAREVLKTLGSKPTHISGDRFKAAPKESAPEKKKPTPAQKRAWMMNIKKAQAARRG